MAMLFPYKQLPASKPIATLNGRLARPKPLVCVTLVGPSDSRAVEALVDTGADDTVFPEALASRLGIDLTGAEEITASGVGTAPAARLRLARVVLLLATAAEQREWPALVAFTSASLRFPLLGFAGCLQFFTATFHGEREQLELAVNALYPGR